VREAAGMPADGAAPAVAAEGAGEAEEVAAAP
jgi:hypothetical protein